MENKDLIHEEEILEFMEGKNSEDLIEILHQVQRLYGYIPKDTVTLISKTIGVPVSKIYGVVTFYTAFSLVPKGKYSISVCMGTACYVKHAEAIQDEFGKRLGIGTDETTDDLQFSIVATRCVGDCAAAPVVIINDKVYEHVTVDQVDEILAEYQ